MITNPPTPATLWTDIVEYIAPTIQLHGTEMELRARCKGIEIKEETLFVSVLGEYSRKWCKDRLTSKVNNYLRGVVGVDKVEFVVVWL